MKRYVLCVPLLLLLSSTARADLLGTAGSFAVLAGSTATNTGTTTIGGNLGVSPGTAVTGFPPGIVTPPGAIYTDTPGTAGTAQDDLTTAYNTLFGLPFNIDLTGQDLGGQTLLPGVYHFDSSAQLTGTLTLDALGSNNAWWVFQIGTTLTTASSSVVQVINGGPGDALYWQVGSSATLGTTTMFEGNIVALTSITLNQGATIPCGRALARNGAVTMDTNVISTGCTAITGVTGWDTYQATELGGPNGNLGTGLNGPAPVPEPSALLLLATCIAGLAIQRKWAGSKPQESRSVSASSFK